MTDAIEIGLQSLRDIIEYYKVDFSVEYNYVTKEYRVFNMSKLGVKTYFVTGSVPVCFAWLNGYWTGVEHSIIVVKKKLGQK